MEASSAVSHRAGRWSVVLWTVLGPLACTLIALGVNHRLFMGLGPLAYQAGLQSALILPLCVGAPVPVLRSRCAVWPSPTTGSVSWRHRRLTACLSRSLSARVDPRRMNAPRWVPARCDSRATVKLINDRWSSGGRQALELIAETLRATVRRRHRGPAGRRRVRCSCPTSTGSDWSGCRTAAHDRGGSPCRRWMPPPAR